MRIRRLPPRHSIPLPGNRKSITFDSLHFRRVQQGGPWRLRPRYSEPLGRQITPAEARLFCQSVFAKEPGAKHSISFMTTEGLVVVKPQDMQG